MAARVRTEEGLQASDAQYRQVADEQAALRRVATLVAAGAPPEEVFTAVTVEVGQLLGVDFASTSRYHPDGAVTVVGAWARSGVPPEFPSGIHLPAGGANVRTRVYETSRPARFDAFVEDLGPATVHALDAACPRLGGRADHCRGSVMGGHHRVVQTGGPAAGRHRGAAGRLYSADRHRHRQR